MLNTLAISGYRSLRSIVLPLSTLSIVTGPNGSGKSNVYRALRLIAAAAQGAIVPALAREGGLASVLWAGPQQISPSVRRGEHPVQGTTRSKPLSLRLGFSADDFSYAIDLGLPAPARTMFTLDPQIKRESLWTAPVYRPASALIERQGPLVRRRDDAGQWQTVTTSLTHTDSLLAQLADPRATPEVLELRERMRAWRFHDSLRTDEHAPARSPQIGTHAPVLAHDGANLAAALQTIYEIGDAEALTQSIDDAFPGSSVEIVAHDTRFSVLMHQHGLLRPLAGSELSDGTLRYLLLAAALLSPRPPALVVLNEPETSLHPDLLPALARLIIRASRNSQIIVVSHANRLVAGLLEHEQASRLQLNKSFGETMLSEHPAPDLPPWKWPSR